MPGDTRHHPAKHDGERRAKTGGGGKAEGERTGEGVGEDGLHLQTGKPQAEADENTGQRLRHAQPPKNRHQLAQACLITKKLAHALPERLQPDGRGRQQRQRTAGDFTAGLVVKRPGAQRLENIIQRHPGRAGGEIGKRQHEQHERRRRQQKQAPVSTTAVTAVKGGVCHK